MHILGVVVSAVVSVGLSIWVTDRVIPCAGFAMSSCIGTYVVCCVVCEWLHSCRRCSGEIETVYGVILSILDYMTFPVRYIADIPTVSDHNSNRWGVGRWYIRRDGRPTVVYSNSDQFWHNILGELSRWHDRPAVVSPVEMCWYIDGCRHRDRGPAVVTRKGYRAYYRLGHFHRDDDEPAQIGPRGISWFIHGVNRRVDTELPSYIDPRLLDATRQDLVYQFTDSHGNIRPPRCVKL